MRKVLRRWMTCLLTVGLLVGSMQFSIATEEGWVSTREGWKYQLDDGSYQTGWFLLDDTTWYFFDKEGIMQTEAAKIGSEVYYFNTAEDGNEGAMQTGLVRIHGKLFYFAGSGACIESVYGKEKPVAMSTFTEDGEFVSRIKLVRDF